MVNYSTLLVTPLLGWMVASCLTVVGYLLALQIKEIRRNRRMDHLRQQLGLRRA